MLFKRYYYIYLHLGTFNPLMRSQSATPDQMDNKLIDLSELQTLREELMNLQSEKDQIETLLMEKDRTITLLKQNYGKKENEIIYAQEENQSLKHAISE